MAEPDQNEFLNLDKHPLRSKKFIAQLIGSLTWKGVLVYGIYCLKADLSNVGIGAWITVSTIVIIAGFLEIGFIGGQAWLDRYVRLAYIASKSVTNDPIKKNLDPDE